MELLGLNRSAATYALACIFERQHLPLVVIADTAKAAEQIIDELGFFVRHLGKGIHFFPPYNILPFKFMAYHNETAARRIRTLYHLIEDSPPSIVVTTADALMQKLTPKKELIRFSELLMVGEEVDRDSLIHKLVAGGYTRATIVEEPGDFGLRGGILDLFSPLYDDPLRIEFYGDTVESIRLFSAETQRTLHNIQEAVLLPAREVILEQSSVTQVVGRIRTRAAEIGLPITRVREIVQRIKAEGIFPGMEGLAPLIYDRMDTFMDYVPLQSLFALIEPGQLRAAAAQFEEQTRNGYMRIREQGRLCIEPPDLYMTWEQVMERLQAFKPLSIEALSIIHPASGDTGQPLTCETICQDTSVVRQSLKSARHSETPFQPLVDWLNLQKSHGYRRVMVCRRPSHVERLKQVLHYYGLETRRVERLSDDAENGRFDQETICLMDGAVSAGFVWPEATVALLVDEEIFGTVYRSRKPIKHAGSAELLNVEDLKQGDLVVHTEHGIGRYEGLTKLKLDNSTNDYLLIIYKDDDKLYMPVERMSLIQKYMGVDGIVPLLDKMGGKTWQRVKDKVKRSAEKIAGELLKLYAARRIQQGHAFGAVDAYFHDFEDGFPFEETEDQRKAIEEVLEDMRKPTPMDRLVCGDVGYGKTEVALRGAFLAVSEAKQAAILVPTTVLAEQHYATFTERFQNYPVRIACLSRFRPLKEQREIIAGLKAGSIDIVVGTHRLLQKDVFFKDLGLLILDEEQRFGVKHKEKIKSLRTTVDVLTLTATPIPRTLHLSLLGIRDISIISTPPEQRRPIITYVSEFDEVLVAEAIRKELNRGGQIFFVHNNIHSIQRMADRLQALVPEVRLGVAHGRMAEENLEKVMLAFINTRLDMLVCTTIIESGLDVATANTILINRADHFGLAQIYQLRGRVGRSDEQAYAYLFIPPESTLSKDAQKRLKVLMEYSDLGSGFQIAMSDLKIRGGGTILGASQSGHIAAVGYDMFLKLMETSIAEIKGEPVLDDLEPEINLPLSAFLPEFYIPDIDQRLSFYRTLARLTDLKAISALKGEMEDRFGRLPDEAGNLLLKIMLKILATRAGCKRLDLHDTQLILQFSEMHQKKPYGLVEMVVEQSDRYRFTPDQSFIATLSQGSPTVLMAQMKNILIEIGRRVNQ